MNTTDSHSEVHVRGHETAIDRNDLNRRRRPAWGKDGSGTKKSLEKTRKYTLTKGGKPTKVRRHLSAIRAKELNDALVQKFIVELDRERVAERKGRKVIKAVWYEWHCRLIPK